jgi:hypothetical protein
MDGDQIKNPSYDIAPPDGSNKQQWNASFSWYCVDHYCQIIYLCLFYQAITV